MHHRLRRYLAAFDAPQQIFPIEAVDDSWDVQNETASEFFPVQRHLMMLPAEWDAAEVGLFLGCPAGQSMV